MSKPSININVTVSITDGVASFNYSPDGPINVTKSTNVVFSLSSACSPQVSFEEPLIAYVPADASHDITTSLSDENKTLTLSDTDIDQEQICVQLVVMDLNENSYASPDPRILNGGR